MDNTDPTSQPTEKKSRYGQWIKRFGVAGFLFFPDKGIGLAIYYLCCRQMCCRVVKNSLFI